MRLSSLSDCQESFLDNGFLNYLGAGCNDKKKQGSIVKRKYMEVIASSLSQCLLANNREQTISEIMSLSTYGIKRLLLSPEICRKLVLWERTGDHSLFKFINSSLKVEMILSGISADSFVSKRMWSSLGDAQIIPSKSIGEGPVIKKGKCLRSWDIPIDWESPDERFKLNDEALKLTRPANKKEASVILDKLSIVENIINKTSTIGFSLIKENTEVIQLYSSDVDSLSYTSSSSRSFTGRVALLNSHLTQIDIKVLTNALIHEAIHSFLYRVEYISPLVKNVDLAINIKVSSPWSGNLLRLPTYIHACYVYYCLYNFWKTDALADFFAPELINEQIEFLKQGFHRNKRILKRKKIYDAVKDPIMNDLNLMRILCS